ncbi:golgin candidate 2 [Olea europaea subsp. europaea]|uniref:Golgin candidate 2 n=1 Tax=Olea europaea subsp. europaea TaxID=158383 RepID=A0A8S0PXT0_OLEEU|nr:golgin candidate 2 [Olea europaea subsp. europaea]
MAHWISSKLKAAETLLHQIDQQAAESLGKNEKPRSDEQVRLETSTRTGETRSLIKEQLKKKVPENVNEKHDLKVISRSDSSIKRDNDVGLSMNINSKSNSSSPPTDGDWTELLRVPNKNMAAGGVTGSQSSIGALGIRGLKKDGKKQGRSGSKALEGIRTDKDQNNGVPKSSRKSNVELENNANGGGSLDSGRASDVGDVMPRTLITEFQSDGGESVRKDMSDALIPDNKNEAYIGKNKELNGIGDGEKLHPTDGLINDNHPTEMVPVSLDGKSDMKSQLKDGERFKSAMLKNNKSKVGSRSSSSMKKGFSSRSDDESDSETDSTSSSDSERERERAERIKRRQQILAERAAAKAVDAIKDRENQVAKLEGEKQSLEKILEERAKQQVREASELQTTMMEVMDAADLEKQKHNNTRMEALVRLSKLETTNADLARSLAASQKNLEVEVDRIAELRQKIQLKEGTHEELRRKISAMHQNRDNLVASKGVEFEKKMLEAEYSSVTDKVERLQEKTKSLETNIETAKREIENPTEVEIQLRQRLDQLTDHLIQKQAQVEALSSEKAMLLFRIEAVSRFLDENKSIMDSADFPGTSSREDLESGVWEHASSKFRPLFKQKIQSGQQQLGLLIRQLDSIFSSGVVFLRRNSTARIWSVVYFICLHLWVLYILMSHSAVSDDTKSGAVVSLENINNTGGFAQVHYTCRDRSSNEPTEW